MVALATTDKRRVGRYLPENRPVRQDDGCFIHPSCASCPLPACITELPLELRKMAARMGGDAARPVLANSIPPDKK